MTGALARTCRSLVDAVAHADLTLYRTVAATRTPGVDGALCALSRLADRSRLWLVVAGLLAATGGRHGRRAALRGLVAAALGSALVDLPIKSAGGRARPDRDAAAVRETRWVPMPASPSFPSGHAASGFAFAAAHGPVRPALSAPVWLLAVAVGYARVHTGVHYPADVAAGAAIGTIVGAVVARVSGSTAGPGAAGRDDHR